MQVQLDMLQLVQKQMEHQKRQLKAMIGELEDVADSFTLRQEQFWLLRRQVKEEILQLERQLYLLEEMLTVLEAVMYFFRRTESHIIDLYEGNQYHYKVPIIATWSFQEIPDWDVSIRLQ